MANRGRLLWMTMEPEQASHLAWWGNLTSMGLCMWVSDLDQNSLCWGFSSLRPLFVVPKLCTQQGQSNTWKPGSCPNSPFFHVLNFWPMAEEAGRGLTHIAFVLLTSTRKIRLSLLREQELSKYNRMSSLWGRRIRLGVLSQNTMSRIPING